MGNNNFNFKEKLFASLCNKNKKWGSEKLDLPDETLVKLQKNEWEIFWAKLGEKSLNFKDKIIVDYGCGYGYDSLFMLQEGASFVYCLEISDERLDASVKLHQSYGFYNVNYIDNSNIKELSKKVGKEKVDVIICRDVMEHIPSPYDALESMYEILKPGGDVYIGFSPLYKSPFGAHFSGLCGIPWIHLFFSEKTVLNVFKELYKISEDINTYLDIPGSGVNKLSYYYYISIIKKFSWVLEKNYINKFPNRGYLTKSLNSLIFLIPFKVLKELFIVNSYSKIKKNSFK